MAREKGELVVAKNRRARYDFFIEDTFEAGIALIGSEVKSLRQGKASISDAYATVEQGELWLENSFIPELVQASWTNHTPRRRRKLLVTRKELTKVSNQTRESGMTLIPLSLYFRDGYAKVEIGIARGKRNFDKRDSLRQKDTELEIRKATKRSSRGEPTV